MPTYAATQLGYHNLWNKAIVDPNRRAKARAIARDIVASRDRFKESELATGVPWFVQGVWLYREASLNFSAYLGNGQPFNKRTTIQPKGRGPFSSFAAGAIDALRLHDLDSVKVWSVERCLYESERWNGWGYLGKTNSPYVWGWTSLYTSGKYVRDHVFDPSYVDQQPGCAALLKALIEVDPNVGSYLAAQGRETDVPKDVLEREKKAASAKARNTAKAGTVAAGSSGAAQAHKDAPDWLGYVTIGLLAVALVAFLVGKFKASRQEAIVQQKWTGGPDVGKG